MEGFPTFEYPGCMNGPLIFLRMFLSLIFLISSILPPVATGGLFAAPPLPALLTPLEVVNARSAKPFERYGIDWDGHCYSCNVAELQVMDSVLWLRNVCDSNLKQPLRLLSLQHNGAQVILRCREAVLVLEKMNEAPVYRLTQPVPLRVSEKLQLRSFYTDKSRITRFAVHDCGDFDG